MSALPTLRLNDGTSHTRSHLNGHVKMLQHMLRPFGFRLPPDGKFGPYTESIVIAFQKSRGLSPDGIVGPRTWQMLVAHARPTELGSTTIPSSAPSSSSSSGIVIAEQPKVCENKYVTTYTPNNQSMNKQLQELQKYMPILRKASEAYNIDLSILAGILSRESHVGLALSPPGPHGTGDHGHGRGLVQVDDRWHSHFTDTPEWKDPRANIYYGVKLLRDFMDYLQRKTSLQGRDLLRAAIASYNAGPGSIMRRHIQGGEPVDASTTGGNYSKDVLSRAGWFQDHGVC